MEITLGYQLPNFTYPDADDLFDTVIAQVREAEAAGFDSVFLMDHVYQLETIGRSDEPMLEAYTSLAALGQISESVLLGAMVTGNTYRNPALLAKTVTTLDVISKGRAVLGIGAGWFEQEHIDYGFDYGTFTERFERLEEALQIITPMLADRRPTFEGKWYRANNAMNVPRHRERVPVMLGGSGEKKTFRLAARFADHMNIICPMKEIPQKVRVLAQRCEEIERDPESLPTSFLIEVIPVDSAAEASRIREHLSPYMLERALIGSPDAIADEIHGRILGAGIGGVVLNLPVNGHAPGNLTAMSTALSQ